MRHRFQYIAVLIGLCLLVQGCPPPVPPVLEEARCPAKRSSAKVMADMLEAMGPPRNLRSGGEMKIDFVDNDGSLRHEQMSMQLRFCPPNKLMIRGDSLLGEVVRMGVNETRYWIRFKPNELSASFSGDRQTLEICQTRMVIQPADLLTVFGEIDTEASWSLEIINGYDVLIKRRFGKRIKAIHVDPCTSLPVKVDIYGEREQLALEMRLYDYPTNEEAIPVARRIRIVNYEEDGTETEMNLRIDGLREFEPTEKQLQGLFAQPDNNGIQKVFVLDEWTCDYKRIIEED